jgi:hypothetical protein
MSEVVTQQGSEVEAALVEVRKVMETAERGANGESAPDVDQVRVTAGLVHHLAEQTERLVAAVQVPVARGTRDGEERRAALLREEDRTPEVPPASPLDDRSR